MLYKERKTFNSHLIKKLLLREIILKLLIINQAIQITTLIQILKLILAELPTLMFKKCFQNIEMRKILINQELRRHIHEKNHHIFKAQNKMN
jgi:hypothetical protein